MMDQLIKYLKENVAIETEKTAGEEQYVVFKLREKQYTIALATEWNEEIEGKLGISKSSFAELDLLRLSNCSFGLMDFTVIAVKEPNEMINEIEKLVSYYDSGKGFDDFDRFLNRLEATGLITDNEKIIAQESKWDLTVNNDDYERGHIEAIFSKEEKFIEALRWVCEKVKNDLLQSEFRNVLNDNAICYLSDVYEKMEWDDADWKLKLKDFEDSRRGHLEAFSDNVAEIEKIVEWPPIREKLSQPEIERLKENLVEMIIQVG